MAQQLNNVQILDESGTLRGLNPTIDYLKITTPFEVGNDVKVGGDLTVNGDIVSKGQQNVIVQDPILDLGLGNTTTSATAGGFTVTMNRASGFTAEMVTTFVAGVGGTSAPTFTVSGGSSALVAGDLVAISGADDAGNDGLYIVQGVAAGVVTIKGTGGTAPSGSVPFAQTQFKAASSQNASVYKVDIAAAVFADGTASFKDPAGGTWAKGTFVTAYAANAVETDFTGNGDYDTAAQTSLQEAYEVGNTITTSAAEGDVTIAGDQKLIVSASGGLQVSGGVLDVDTSVDVDLTGAFAVDGGQAVAFGASTAVASFAATATGDIALTAGGKLDMAATGAVEIDAGSASYIKATAANLTVEASGAGILDLKSGTEVQVSTVLFDVNASGAVEIASVGSSFVQTTSGDLLIQTLISGELDLTSAGLMNVNAGADLDLDVTGKMELDASGMFSIDAGAASNLTAQGNLSVQAQGAGNDLILEAADVIDMNGASLDADLSGAFNVTGGAESKLNTSAGDLILDAEAGSLILDGGEAAADAVRIVASNAAGGMDIDAGTGGIAMDSTGAVSIGAVAASDFTVSTGDLSLIATAASVVISGGEAAADAVKLDAAAGGLDLNAALGITLDAGGAISLDSTATASNFSLTANSADPATLTIAAANAGAGAANLDIDVKSAVTIDSASISLDATNASNLTVTGSGESLTLAAAGGGAQKVEISSAGTGANAIFLNATAGGIDVDADDDITIDTAKGLSLQAAGDSDLSLIANEATDQKLTIKASNSGAGKALVSVESEEGIALTSSAGSSTIQRTSAGLAFRVRENSNDLFDVNDKQVTSYVNHRFDASAGVQLQASAALDAGLVCAFDAAGKMLKADCAAGANSPSAQDEVTRYPFAATVSSMVLDASAMMQTIPGTKALLSFDSAPSAGLVGQSVFLGTGAAAGKVTLTAPTTSNASIWRVGILAGTTASGGLYPVYWQPQYLGRRPVS